MLDQVNNKAEAMSDNDLGTILATFLKSQEKRDELLRAELAKVEDTATKSGRDASEALTIIRSLEGKIETAFDLFNQAARDGKTNWGNIYTAIGVVVVIMTAILSPIVASISANKAVVTMLASEQGDMKVVEAEMRMRQEWSNDILMLTNDYESRMNRVFTGQDGTIGHPNRGYTPLKGR
jgi:hypothetical protein